jgi:hypothetical protein
LSALGARETASLVEGDVDLQPLAGAIKGATVNLPGGFQSEGLLQQLSVLHLLLSSFLFGDKSMSILFPWREGVERIRDYPHKIARSRFW